MNHFRNLLGPIALSTNEKSGALMVSRNIHPPKTQLAITIHTTSKIILDSYGNTQDFY